MRDIWRHIVTAMFPTWAGRRAAVDGGPGPDPYPHPVDGVRMVRLPAVDPPTGDPDAATG